MARRRVKGLVAVAVAAAAVTLGACGRDDFENEPRPPVPFEVSVELGPKAVVLSPAEFGAGIATFTIANLSDDPVRLSIDGPTTSSSDEILPGDTGVLKTEVVTGDYEAAADGTDATPFEFAVGPERESAQDELLLP
ncbi:hypothetical protein BH20ACT15_BH20ACT15_12380 [soil metagenome]